MEGLLILIGLVVLAIPVAVIYLLVAVARLKSEVRALNALALARRSPIVQETPATVRPRPEETGQTAAIVQETPKTVPETPPVAADTARDMPEPLKTVQKTPKAPWGDASPAQRPEPVAPAAPGIVFRFAEWLRDNWFYAISALSLALAGVFLVQYGIEAGLLTPTMRVMAALALGAALIIGGETIRRRFGDGEDSSTAYLPSVLSGAGLVSLFGGVLAARLMYDLIAAGPAFAGLVAVTALGLVLGWMTGPLLAAVALLGGFAAPFLVGGESDSYEWLMGYFALLAGLGLGIDTMRRWAWVSVLSLALGFGAGSFLWLGAGGESLGAAFMALSVVLVLLATLIPARALWPDHAAPCIAEFLVTKSTEGPKVIFPVWLSMGAVLAACAVLLHLAGDSETLFWMAAMVATTLAAVLILWSGRAPGLADMAAMPAATLLALIALPDLHHAARMSMLAGIEAVAEQTETRMVMEPSWLFAMALALTLLAAWRSLATERHPVFWAGAAALLAPLAGLALELSWAPAKTIGAWPWALHALALAAIMTLLAERFARRDGEDHMRAALATLSALATLAFACTVLLTSAALTLALAVTVCVAAVLDRKFLLPPMQYFIMAGVVALGYRLGYDPGLDWATRAPVLEMLAAYGGTCLLLFAALLVLPDRPKARVFLESAVWATGGMTASLLLYHIIDAFAEQSQGSHWDLGIHATIWAALALAQLERLQLGGSLRWVRIAMATGFGLFALALLLAAATLVNPLFDRQEVLGIALINTLIPAYLLPAAVIGIGAWRLHTLPRIARLALGGMSTALTVLWAGLAIRHFWRGSEGMVEWSGTSQPELYSYTVAILLVGAVLFYQGLARHSVALRRAGTLVISLAVAKVFLIDASGLTGLARVMSFLLLGLSLAGLAWLNRWAEQRLHKD